MHIEQQPNGIPKYVPDQGDDVVTITLANGVALESTGTPALNGNYSVDTASQFAITVEYVSICLEGTFTDGTTSKPWPDSQGNPSVFGKDEFRAFAKAVAAYVDAVKQVGIELALGVSADFPSNAITIP